MKSRFEKEIIVAQHHIDELEHVNNVVYVQWVQDIAGEHWLSQVSEEIKQSVLWVVKRHVIDYKAPCWLHEKLLIKTETPEKYHGPLWDRNIWIYKPGDQLAVEAVTTWCLLDRKSQRPIRITPEIHQVFIENASS